MGRTATSQAVDTPTTKAMGYGLSYVQIDGKDQHVFDPSSTN